MDIMTHAKFYFNTPMLTLIFAIWASEPPRAWRTTEKAGPDRVKIEKVVFIQANRSFDLSGPIKLAKFRVYIYSKMEHKINKIRRNLYTNEKPRI